MSSADDLLDAVNDYAALVQMTRGSTISHTIYVGNARGGYTVTILVDGETVVEQFHPVQQQAIRLATTRFREWCAAMESITGAA